MIRSALTMRLANTRTGSVWTSDTAPSGLLRRIFKRLRSDRHGPDGPLVVTPFG
ncbi:hypothetical protein HZF05_09945 [Sphingomonas sp. CGMCC 1.13654]|uniref:Uncharacterized protein n=1 Tax=Sphingomonas chungangi TaxID=2683589 RepID=A0A838L7D2_9SPHN|nr:hypothetical protein [Sphingomonas chungangi]MBA2934419.1 hypothetical protein [Sphingomonas chungangi]MVW57458.1 hypothetical protein [Sphingomonas chungangi]